MSMQIFISAGLVLLGWFVVHRLTMSREKKREWREIAKKTVSNIETLESLTIKYHTSDVRSINLERKIRKDLERLNDQLWRIKEKLSFSMDIRDIRQAITLENFGTTSFAQQTTHSPIIHKIEACSTKLIRELYIAE